MDTSADQIFLGVCEQPDEKTTYERLVCVCAGVLACVCVRVCVCVCVCVCVRERDSLFCLSPTPEWKVTEEKNDEG